MGLTSDSTGISVLEKEFNIKRITPNDKVIALAGNPNVGKSTIFNSLTGLNQHTGNWPGKTVANAQGTVRHKNENYILVDIPGTYSLMANSVEEEIARDFICFGEPDAVIVVADATLLERNLNLVLQTLEITNKVVVCVNLIDEAKRKKININIKKLSKLLGVPVVATSASKGEGLNELLDAVSIVTDGYIKPSPVKIKYVDAIESAVSILEPYIKQHLNDKLNSRWVALKLLDGDSTLLEAINRYLGFNLFKDEDITQKLDEAINILCDAGITKDILRDKIVCSLYAVAEEITSQTVSFEREKYDYLDRKIDRILASKTFGIPIMLALLGAILWITITGANYPSQLLADGLFWIEDRLSDFFYSISAPEWVHGVLVMGVYRTLAWVVSVMLPPMAIFFPLFTLLEDLGYLPRVAFNLDNFFKKACCHGKQALTMCMGLGCNAAGIIGCRIIDSPRERLIAILTNNFVPCNGRFPTLIAIITMFFAGSVLGPAKSVIQALMLVSVLVLGVVITLLVSKILSKTLLKGLPSSFALELPPYRKPQVGRIIVRSIFDRTLFVLGRAVMVAAPAGLIIWFMANVQVGGVSILNHCANFLNPFAQLIGMDGFILMAFILGFPANEIVVPIIIMSYMATGSMIELDSLEQLRELLVSNGWTWLTAVCVMLFSLMHFPCGTTCLTIRKETQSLEWTIAAFLIPTITGILICFIVANTARLLGLA
ncbi:MAG: ferrous iron transport protein B [Clostridiaceae bacterium]|nr:ferrous iron transport protein B [Clostridiaceae bacterium]